VGAVVGDSVKFTIPEPPQPYCPFALNLRAGIQLDASGGVLYVEFAPTETPLHPGAMEHQAMRAWGQWDADGITYRTMLWPPIALGSMYQGKLVTARWII
jgi:hypothetical protein